MNARLIAYETAPSDGFELVTAPHGRDWMDTTYDRSAYRCLPLLIANQAGWLILNPATVRVKWDGGPNLDAIELQRWQPATHPQVLAAAAAAVGGMIPSIGDGQASRDIHGAPAVPDSNFPMSHFGVGIITWTLPFLFRTPPGYNLLVRGPANQVKDGVAPLEGIVETDWSPSTFTMNWRMTRPDTWVTFAKGEPICMIVPQRRGELEEFTPEILPIGADPALDAANARWCESRGQFNTDRKQPGSVAAKAGWEKHYFQGTAPDGLVAPEHQTRLRLRPFTRDRVAK